MFSFDTLSETTANRIIREIAKTLYSSKILSYIKSGKATYFGFDSEQELWEDCILFRPHMVAEFVCCTDYISGLNDTQRAGNIRYMLNKLKTTFKDWKDEKILEEVREFINTFENYETNCSIPVSSSDHSTPFPTQA